ncbi:MAG: BHL, histone-like protein [uncultured bacterium]|nr:MAG: BHL, histone-like protein [uncultured bacterium]
MNKSDLINQLTDTVHQPRKRVEDAVNLIFDSMSGVLADGGRIEIRGFGSFVPRKYDAYKGRNPRTGESIEVSPKKLPFFKVGKELRQRVDGQAVDASDDDTVE